MGMLVSYLPDPENHPLWPHIEKMLEPASKYEGTPIREEDEFVWIAFEGPILFAAGTTIICGEDAQIRLCGGSRHKEWVGEAERQVSAWARKCGCKRLTMHGRKGWARYFDWNVSERGGRYDYEKVL